MDDLKTLREEDTINVDQIEQDSIEVYEDQDDSLDVQTEDETITAYDIVYDVNTVINALI